MVHSHHRCPICKVASPSGAWNLNTLALCKSREQKRGFKKIQMARGTNRAYECPHCGELSAIKNITDLHKDDLKPGDHISMDGNDIVDAPKAPIVIGPGKPIAGWEELALEVSRTHRLEIDLEGGNGWVIPNEPGKEHYLHTHTFYGTGYLEQTKMLQDCGFYVVLANWDAEGSER